MDWTAIRFDWNRARAFLVTAEEGSLSAAARALGMAQPTLGRQVAALEQELGVTLFERTGRGLALTAAGAGLLDHVRRMGRAAGEMSLAATGQAQTIEGRIILAASEFYAAHLLPPVLLRLRREAPGLAIEINASNATADLHRREADIALRSFRPSQPDLIGRRLGDDRARLYATPGYLDRIGNPRAPADLAHAEILGFDGTETMRNGLSGLGLSLTPANFPVTVPNHLVQWEMARAGVGIGVFPERSGDSDPVLVRVLPDLPPFTLPIWLVAHRELRTSRRIRYVFDTIAETLAT